MKYLTIFLFSFILHCFSAQSTNVSEIIKFNCEGNNIPTVCDPLNILDSHGKQMINTNLESTFINTCAPTPEPKVDIDSENDDEADDKDNEKSCRCGVHSYLVVVKNLDGFADVKKKQSNILANRVLSSKQYDACSVVLLATEEEKIFGIAVGEDAKEYISAACLFPIYQSSDALNFTQQLINKIKEYIQIIEQKHSCSNTEDTYDDFDLRRKVAIPILLLLGALIIAIIVAVVILHRRSQQKSANTPETQNLSAKQV